MNIVMKIKYVLREKAETNYVIRMKSVSVSNVNRRNVLKQMAIHVIRKTIQMQNQNQDQGQDHGQNHYHLIQMMSMTLQMVNRQTLILTLNQILMILMIILMMHLMNYYHNVNLIETVRMEWLLLMGVGILHWHVNLVNADLNQVNSVILEMIIQSTLVIIRTNVKEGMYRGSSKRNRVLLFMILF